MSVRMRHTSSHTKNRRSHHALTGTTVVTDKENGSKRLPHRLDETTGMYRGKQIVSAESLKRRQARAERLARRSEVHEHSDIENVPAGRPEIHSEKEEKKEGVLGRLTKGRAKSRSGLGGGGS